MLATIGYTLVAVCSISAIEFFSRTVGTMPGALLRSAPFIIVSQICLYNIFNSAPSVIAAWLGFTLAMSFGRILNSTFILKESLDLPWLLASVSCMVIAALCMKQAHA